jgi:hypothetical protein
LIRPGYIFNRVAAEAACVEQGLKNEFIFDIPEVDYPPPFDRTVIIFSLRGLALLRMNGQEHEVRAGHIVTIPRDTIYTIKAGHSGWEYVIGWASEKVESFAS